MKIQLMLMAAGQSKRFAGIKQLADIHGQPMLRHCLEQYRPKKKWIEGLHSGFVILGANAASVSQVMPQEVEHYIADKWKQGLGHSVAQGMAYLAKDTTHVLVGLGDQVALTKSMIRQLISTSQVNPRHIIAAQYADTLGAPVIFPKFYFNQLKQLSGDKGAKVLLQNNQQNIVAVKLAAAKVDIDTQTDLNQYLATIAH